MDRDPSAHHRLLTLYGKLARRLAYAITGSSAAATRIAQEAAGACAGSTVDTPGWADYLAAVRSRSFASTASAARPAPGIPTAKEPETVGTTDRDRDRVRPGRATAEPAASRLPIDEHLLRGCFSSLSQREQDLLWSALLSPSPPGADPKDLGSALEHLRLAVTSASFPSEEDIP